MINHAASEYIVGDKPNISFLLQHMVFYRKYRPQTLEQLIGQTIVRDTLLKAFQSGKLTHAYLFCGPRGVGKTSTARLLAKLVNCETSVIPAKAGISVESAENGSPIG